MPLPSYRDDRDRRDRSRIGLLLLAASSSRRKMALTLLTWTSLAVLYSYSFFVGIGWQQQQQQLLENNNNQIDAWQQAAPQAIIIPEDRSFATIHTINQQRQARYIKRRDLLRRQRKGEYVKHELDEMDMEGMSEWQRRIRVGAAGEMVWKQEQELWLGIGEEEEVPPKVAKKKAVVDRSNLRGKTTPTDGDNSNNQNDGDKRRKPKQRTSEEATADLLVMMFVFFMTRAMVQICATYRQFGFLFPETGDADTAATNNNNTITRTTRVTSGATRTTGAPRRSTNNSGRAALARLMVPQSIHAHAALLRTARFRAWVTNLNRERAINGQPPLSMDSLRLVLRDSDFDGNDYDALVRFNEEATLAESTGATQADIDRCPQRVLEDSHDDLLTTPAHQVHHHHASRASADGDGNIRQHLPSPAQQCPICLEAYQPQDNIRTIPCFHEFHSECIDPWLAHKAVCPVCKHPVVG